MMKKNRTVSQIPKAKKYDKVKVRKHRNLIPKFTKEFTPKSYTQKRLLERAYIHDLKRNRFLNALRLAKGEKESIRSERREMLSVLIPLLISHTSLRLTDNYLFEVQASVETLARQSNQLQVQIDKETGKQRFRYDTVNRALIMLEEAELIIIHRQIDSDKGQYKAMRIWLTVDFFTMLGFKPKELQKLLLKFHKYQFINNQIESGKAFYKSYYARLERSNVANLKGCYELHNKLVGIRKDFLGEKLIHYVNQKKPIDYQDQVISDYPFAVNYRSERDCNSTEEVAALRDRILRKKIARDSARLRARQRRLLSSLLRDVS